jgi:hypothetical protein
MASQAYMVIVHDDGRPTEVILPDGRMGLLFPRADDNGENMFYGAPEIGKGVFRKTPDNRESFVLAGVTPEEARKELTDPNGDLHQYGAGSWELVERTTVTFW